MKITSTLLVVCLITACSVTAQTYVPVPNDTRLKIQPIANIKVYAFEPGDVRLLESPFKRAQDASVSYLLKIEPDRLLSQFRSHAGLQPKGERYGGWESEGLAGHSLGHYLSGCALYYAETKDPEFLKRVNYIVEELALCQSARGTGYVGAIPNEDSVFAQVARGDIRSHGFDLNGAWSPWYTVHKVMAGLLDAYFYCHNETALMIETGMADWTWNVLKDLTDAQVQKMLFCEYGGMNDVLANTYAITGNRKYLQLSNRFHDRRILDSLARGVDVLPGKHSNTQVPKVIGTARRYEITGTQRDFDIADFFWNTMVEHHTYAPGGNSNYEYLSPQDELNDRLTDNTMETCNTHNMLKLTQHLFALHPSAAYMDYYERALYNHILASQNHDNGMTCYFVPLRMGTRKEFSDEFNTFTCCVGTGMENHVKYGSEIYSRGNTNDLYVNLFIPSELNWKEQNTTITLHSNLPLDPLVSIEINPGTKSKELTLYIRKPYWVTVTPEFTINGRAINVSATENGYLAISGKWKKGDVLKFKLPSSLHTMPMPDNHSRMAFFYGPVLLAGNLGTKEPDPMHGTPVFVINTSDIDNWIKQEPNSLDFKTIHVGKPADVTFQPFYNFTGSYYSVYFDVFTPNEWDNVQAAYAEQKKKEAEIEKSTIDVVRLGEMQPERDHELTSERSDVGEDHTRKFRVAHDGGSFSFKMKVTDSENKLICMYWGMDNRGRTFEIYIDNELLVTEDLNKYKDSKFYEISYSIPAKLTAGKTFVTITFKPKKGNEAGPLYGSRMVKN